MQARALVNKGFPFVIRALAAGGYAVRMKEVPDIESDIALKSNQNDVIFRQVPAKIAKDIVPKMQSLPDLVKDLIMTTDAIQSLGYMNQYARLSPDGIVRSYVPSIQDIEAKDWYVVVPDDFETETV
jgi:hypothetical protein